MQKQRYVCRNPITMKCCRLKPVCLQQVYKAYRNGVQVVAVKIFTDQVPGDNQLRYAEAFRREIFILRSCHDRNIVQFLGACLQVGSHVSRHALYEVLVKAVNMIWQACAWVQQPYFAASLCGP